MFNQKTTERYTQGTHISSGSVDKTRTNIQNNSNSVMNQTMFNQETTERYTQGTHIFNWSVDKTRTNIENNSNPKWNKQYSIKKQPRDIPKGHI